MTRREVYVSVDIESDGPSPGPHSMLSLGAAAFTIDWSEPPKGAMIGTWSANLATLDGASGHPATMTWWASEPAAWAACRIDPQPPAAAMADFAAWLKALPGRPVFVAYPAGFDFTFVYWYLVRFTGDSPFSHAALDMKSMAMALTQENLVILRLLSDVTLRMIEGQVLEIEREADLSVREEQHIDIIRRKTADLFAACMRIGAILGNASSEKEQALADYGLALGLAFQMKDDLLDFTASESALGKPVGLDLREGKLTLPVIYMLGANDQEAREKVEMVVEDRSFARVSHPEVVALARRTGALERAAQVAAAQAAAAKHALGALDPSPVRNALMALPDFILARDH